MPWAPHPVPAADDPTLEVLTDVLDSVLAPLGFFPGQVGASGGCAQVIFCRSGDHDDDECADLVIDLAASPAWLVVDVRYWGFPADRWHLDFDRDATLPAQTAGLARTLPHDLQQ